MYIYIYIYTYIYICSRRVCASIHPAGYKGKLGWDFSLGRDCSQVSVWTSVGATLCLLSSMTLTPRVQRSNICEPQLRARLGTAVRFCEATLCLNG